MNRFSCTAKPKDLSSLYSGEDGSQLDDTEPRFVRRTKDPIGCFGVAYTIRKGKERSVRMGSKKNFTSNAGVPTCEDPRVLQWVLSNRGKRWTVDSGKSLHPYLLWRSINPNDNRPEENLNTRMVLQRAKSVDGLTTIANDQLYDTPKAKRGNGSMESSTNTLSNDMLYEKIEFSSRCPSQTTSLSSAFLGNHTDVTRNNNRPWVNNADQRRSRTQEFGVSDHRATQRSTQLRIQTMVLPGWKQRINENQPAMDMNDYEAVCNSLTTPTEAARSANMTSSTSTITTTSSESQTRKGKRFISTATIYLSGRLKDYAQGESSGPKTIGILNQPSNSPRIRAKACDLQSRTQNMKVETITTKRTAFESSLVSNNNLYDRSDSGSRSASETEAQTFANFPLHDEFLGLSLIQSSCPTIDTEDDHVTSVSQKIPEMEWDSTFEGACGAVGSPVWAHITSESEQNVTGRSFPKNDARNNDQMGPVRSKQWCNLRSTPLVKPLTKENLGMHNANWAG
ncbi:hypothetical protein T265_07789 [Opisthorchis viverrini]|uniref:Uncharacterized protein n=1 Tax=Opisthorchis viverrini TaxID=6198 RepID=A0A075AAK8_OPIVI|nr:hypothetical protein T265_07789 [Opisthorchis viverrini]KER24599.1 hypothetical protein T265_07789 [Opisthorchis viverrini]